MFLPKTRHVPRILTASGALAVLAMTSVQAASAAPANQPTRVNTGKATQQIIKVQPNADRSAVTIKVADSRSKSSRNRNQQARHYNVVRRSVQSTNRNRGYRTPYRSSVGISFNFGTPGYSRYRWAPAAHSFYRPTYGSYSYYQNRTTCRRVVLDGWHHGRPAPVSVKQCSNPWDGTYIVQGSERLAHIR